jgi:oligosaccharide repeat unit polymerase
VSADLSFLWLTAGFGVLAALGLLLSRWPGWVGFPLSILAIRFGVDAGIAPLTRYEFGIGQLKVEDVTIIGPAPADEIAGAVAMLALGYGSIAAGMLGVRAFASRAVPPDAAAQPMSMDVAKRGWRASVWVFLFGILVNTFAVLVAGTGLEFDEIASTRAAYTNQAAYGSAWFNYAWILKTTMQIGALGMLVFAYRLRRNVALAWGANLLYFAVQPIFGGRTAIVVGGLALALTYHHGIRKLRTGSVLLIVAAVLGGLMYIATVRHKAGSVPQALAMSVTQLGSSRAMEEVAFARREFPENVPYFMGSTIIAGFSMALPGLDVGQNLWRTIEDEFLAPGYRTAAGIGGQTISTTGENYMNFGIVGVIGIGLLAGMVFGSVYEWQRRNPANPFAVLLAAMITVVFIVAIYKKLPTRMSDIPMRMLVPLGFIAAYAAGGRIFRGYAQLAALVLAGLVLFRLTTSPLVKYLTLLPIIAIFVYSVYAQVIFGRVALLRRRPGGPAADESGAAVPGPAPPDEPEGPDEPYGPDGEGDFLGPGDAREPAGRRLAP